MGSALRTLAAQRKQARSLAEISWGGDALSLPDGADGDDAAPRDDSEARMTERINELALEPEWMEHLDGFLWQQELVLMRLNQAIPKKRYVKRLGERIADVLQAHVVQNAGHTVLLYRPGKPPILNLERLVANKRQGEGDGKWAH
jgi:RNA-binding protein YhbY